LVKFQLFDEGYVYIAGFFNVDSSFLALVFKYVPLQKACDGRMRRSWRKRYFV